MSRGALPIDETPLPLAAWSGSDATAIEVLTSDIGRLMREIAELRLSLAEAERAQEKRTERLLLQILEAIDGFERVFRSAKEKEDQVTKQMKIWLGNFRTVRRLLDNILDEQGVTPIRNLEQGFDPHWHKVVETVADPSRADGTIAEELRHGYLRGTSILRKSEVVVVNNEA